MFGVLRLIYRESLSIESFVISVATVLYTFQIYISIGGNCVQLRLYLQCNFDSKD